MCRTPEQLTRLPESDIASLKARRYRRWQLAKKEHLPPDRVKFMRDLYLNACDALMLKMAEFDLIEMGVAL